MQMYRLLQCKAKPDEEEIPEEEVELDLQCPLEEGLQSELRFVNRFTLLNAMHKLSRHSVTNRFENFKNWFLLNLYSKFHSCHSAHLQII